MSSKMNELAEALRFQTNGRIQDADERNSVIAEKNHQLLQLRDELATEKAKVEKLREAITKAMMCPTCEGTGKFTPECYACLSGEPSHCICASMEEETCPLCNGTCELLDAFPDLEKALKETEEK